MILEESGTDNWVGGFNYKRSVRWRLGLELEEGDFKFKPLTDDFYPRRSSQERTRDELIQLLWPEA